MNNSAKTPEPLRNDSGNPPLGFRSSRARAEQGAGSREQGAWKGELPQTARERAQAPTTNATETRIRLREIHHLDALAIAVVAIRPEWAPDLVRAVLSRTPASPRDLTRHALECALDPGVNHPARIENLDRRAYEPTPLPPTVAELRTRPTCQHGAPSGACALCRNGVE